MAFRLIFQVPFIAIALSGVGARVAAADLRPTDAETDLQAIITRQQQLFATAEAESFDENAFRRGMQRLAFDYEDFLKLHPDYPPALTAYGVMLGRIDMRRESVALLMKADGLFAQAAEDEANRTPAFLRTWALAKNQIGNYVVEEGRPVEGASHYLAAIDLVPDEPLYHYQFGSVLYDASDEFLREGTWTRESIERAVHEAFRRAAELAPDRIEFTYRYAESFYDMQQPDWEGALAAWTSLEEKAESEVERQTMRLHAANVLIRQGRIEHARAVLTTVTDPALASQKEKLVAEIPAPSAE
jgi:tetratricopeptide (TPR) repeat protein